MIKSALQSSLTNDVKYRSMSAGAVPSSEYLIASTVLTQNEPSVTFNNLAQYAGVYKHLQIMATTKGSPTNNDFLFAKMNFNADTGGNYNQHLLAGNGSIVSSSSTTYSFLVAGIPQNSNTSGDFCASIIDILDPFETTKFTTARTMTGILGSFNRIFFYSGLWRNTNALTSITIAHETANFATGSRFSLYGVTA